MTLLLRSWHEVTLIPGIFSLTLSLELEEVEIRACRCFLAALQLLSRGLFPCAPVAPTLAVDIKMLDFVRELFVRMPPNTTSWCDTVEAFLVKQRFKLKTRVCFLVLAVILC